ncbi:MAG TPA: hypothetical protein VGF93_09535 [Solirubrobacteraceae bacterium]
MLAGCGLASGSKNEPVTVTVTRDFGSEHVATVTVPRKQSSESMKQLLSRSLRARVAADGTVESIDGVPVGSRQRWFRYVNGTGSTSLLELTNVHPGDQVWWDLHSDILTTTARAVVGAYPEPFEHGAGGRRLPTTLGCGTDVDAACKQVAAALAADGVKVANSLLGTGSGQDSLNVVVGTWKEIEGELVATLVDHGPSASGIYARFTDGGAMLQLLDAQGRVVRTLGAASGLVAATRDTQSEPTWLITGTDAAGVTAAARALTPARLRRRFAVAVSGSDTFALPASFRTPVR